MNTPLTPVALPARWVFDIAARYRRMAHNPKSVNAIRTIFFSVLVGVLSGCDAESAASTNTNAAPASATAVGQTNVASAAVSTNTAATVAATNAVPGVGTNQVSVTNITNTQTTVINTAPVPAPDIKLSKELEEIVKMAKSGVDETVILAYIEKQNKEFKLTAEEIVYLSDLGISTELIAALMNHAPIDVAKTEPAASAPPITAAPAPGGQPAPAAVQTNYIEVPANPPQQVVTVPAAAPAETVVVQPPAQVTYQYFYSSLAPYGTWVEVDGYGLCWQPTVSVVHRGWQPYCDRGRWLYSSYGWYWQSDYSWGWAPFHYGRWHRSHRLGWVWAPDCTWGPSWVSWRYTDSYCGWAPLPPAACYRPGFGFSYYDSGVSVSFGFNLGWDHYTFVPSSRFCSRNPWDYRVPHDRSVNIYKDSTVINNYIVGNNNTIINEGIGRDRISRATRQEIRPVEVRDLPATAGRVIQPERLEREGNKMVVYRPTPPPQTAEGAIAPAVARSRGEPRQQSGEAVGGSAGTVIKPGNVPAASSGFAAGRPAPVPGNPSNSGRSETARTVSPTPLANAGSPASSTPTTRPESATAASGGSIPLANVTRSEPRRAPWSDPLSRQGVREGGGLVSTRGASSTPSVRPESTRTESSRSVSTRSETPAPQAGSPLIRPNTPAVSSRPLPVTRGSTETRTVAPSRGLSRNEPVAVIPRSETPAAPSVTSPGSIQPATRYSRIEEARRAATPAPTQPLINPSAPQTRQSISEASRLSSRLETRQEPRPSSILRGEPSQPQFNRSLPDTMARSTPAPQAVPSIRSTPSPRFELPPTATAPVYQPRGIERQPSFSPPAAVAPQISRPAPVMSAPAPVMRSAPVMTAPQPVTRSMAPPAAAPVQPRMSAPAATSPSRGSSREERSR